MTRTLEIPNRDWEEYLNAFSGMNRGRPVRLEVAVRAGEGEPLLAEHQPLMGVGFDAKGSEAPAIIVTLGGADVATPSFTHVINHPTHLWVEEEADGLSRAVDILSTDEGKTLLIFERVAALPREATSAARERAG